VDGVHATAEPAQPDPAGEVEHDLDELLARAGKADEYLALAQRTQADFENFRKRMTRDVAAAETRGVSRLAKELLPALDNLGRALAAAEAGGEHGTPEHHLTSGIKLVHDELLAALGRSRRRASASTPPSTRRSCSSPSRERCRGRSSRSTSRAFATVRASCVLHASS
jgi:molecular chaperone GrpE